MYFKVYLQDGYTIQPGPGVNLHNDGAGGGVLEMASGEGGWYQCTAFNTAGSCTTRARVTVNQQSPNPTPKPAGPNYILPTTSRTILPE